MAHSGDVEGNDLAPGHPTCNWRKQRDVAANAVEHQEGYTHARSILTADAQRLAVDLQHFERERKLSVIASAQAFCGDNALHFVQSEGVGGRVHGTQSLCNRAFYGIARKSLRKILPTFDFGRVSRKHTSFGTL